MNYYEAELAYACEGLYHLLVNAHHIFGDRLRLEDIDIRPEECSVYIHHAGRDHIGDQWPGKVEPLLTGLKTYAVARPYEVPEPGPLTFRNNGETSYYHWQMDEATFNWTVQALSTLGWRREKFTTALSPRIVEQINEPLPPSTADHPQPDHRLLGIFRALAERVLGHHNSHFS